MNLKRLLLITLVSGLLSGCFTTKVVEYRVIKQTQYMNAEPMTNWLKPTTLPSPPPLSAYRGLSFDEREDLLIRHSLKQYEALASCNADKLAQLQSIESRNTAINELNENEEKRVQELMKKLEAMNGQ
jgi:hypothetical protein